MKDKKTGEREKEQVKEKQELYPENEEWAGPYELIEGVRYGEKRYEIIDGVRYEFLASPVIIHQKIVAALHIMLYQTCHANGTILFAPMDVYLDKDALVQPDLIYVSHENESILKGKYISGAPDLLAEVLSPSTSEMDKIQKKRLYEQHGVREYWIVDPVHGIVDQFVHRKGKLELYATYGKKDRVVSPVIPCINVEVGKLFAGIEQE